MQELLDPTPAFDADSRRAEGMHPLVFDLDLADQVRDVLGPRPDLVEKKMFGGLAFLLRGNMCVGVRGDELIMRVGVEQADDALAQPGTRPFVSRGRPMSGWVVVAAGAASTADLLIEWVDRALRFVDTLPAAERPKSQARKSRT